MLGDCGCDGRWLGVSSAGATAVGRGTGWSSNGGEGAFRIEGVKTGFGRSATRYSSTSRLVIPAQPVRSDSALSSVKCGARRPATLRLTRFSASATRSSGKRLETFALEPQRYRTLAQVQTSDAVVEEILEPAVERALSPRHFRNVGNDERRVSVLDEHQLHRRAVELLGGSFLQSLEVLSESIDHRPSPLPRFVPDRSDVLFGALRVSTEARLRVEMKKTIKSSDKRREKRFPSRGKPFSRASALFAEGPRKTCQVFWGSGYRVHR